MDYRQMRIRVIKYAYSVSLFMMLITLFLKSKITFISGVFFGTSIASLMFYQMTNSLRKASMMMPDQAQRYATSRYAMRMLVYAVCIIVSIKSSMVNEFGTIIGLFSIKIAILYMTFMKKLD